MEKEILLNNGVKIPTPGFGTFLTPDGATCVEAVKAAIAAGYTHIDTAAVYKNEKSVGEGIKESGIKREMLQTGVLPLVKSVTPSRIKENFDVFDFELSQQEMFEIASLKADRIGSDPDTCDF